MVNLETGRIFMQPDKQCAVRMMGKTFSVKCQYGLVFCQRSAQPFCSQHQKWEKWIYKFCKMAVSSTGVGSQTQLLNIHSQQYKFANFISLGIRKPGWKRSLEGTEQVVGWIDEQALSLSLYTHLIQDSYFPTSEDEHSFVAMTTWN